MSACQTRPLNPTVAHHCHTLILLHQHPGVTRKPQASCLRAGGWFARDPSVLKKVGGVLLQPSGSKATNFSRLLVGKDAFDLCQAPTRDAIFKVCWDVSHSMPSTSHFNTFYNLSESPSTMCAEMPLILCPLLHTSACFTTCLELTTRLLVYQSFYALCFTH